MPNIKTFISYSHKEHEREKEFLSTYIDSRVGFSDESVEVGDIDDRLDDQSIRKIIRDDYLKDTTVTIVLVGERAKDRKHIDWEIFSSMYDGEVNKQSGIVVIDMIHDNTRTRYDSVRRHYDTNWVTIPKSEIRRRYDFMPKRIVDNLIKEGVSITVIPWTKIYYNKQLLLDAITEAHNNRRNQKYDLSEPMRKHNNNSSFYY